MDLEEAATNQRWYRKVKHLNEKTFHQTNCPSFMSKSYSNNLAKKLFYFKEKSEDHSWVVDSLLPFNYLSNFYNCPFSITNEESTSN